VLADGRILFEAGFPLGSGATPELYLVYADGSGVESYRCDHGHARWGGRQLVRATWCLRTELRWRGSPHLWRTRRVAAPHAEYAGAIAETAQGEWLVSARTRRNAAYALKLWKPGAPAMETVLAESGENLVEPVLLAPRTAPQASFGAAPLELRQHAGAGRAAFAGRRFEGCACNGASGDGWTPGARSGDGNGAGGGGWLIFCEGPGDKPIRFALLDAKGAVVRQEHGMVLDSERGTAHLRGLPHGAGACVGKSCARRAVAHYNAGGSDR
jgi:hypothetical protein